MAETDYQYRRGDRVLVRGVVDWAHAGSDVAHVKFLRPMIADPTPAYAVSLLCIHSLIGREFCVGDMVDTDDDERGQIKWLDENFALVRLANTPLNVSPKVVLRDCLRFAEEGEEQ